MANQAEVVVKYLRATHSLTQKCCKNLTFKCHYENIYIYTEREPKCNPRHERGSISYNALGLPRKPKIIEWMNERANKETKQQMNEQTNKQTNEWMNERTNERTARTNEWMNESINQFIYLSLSMYLSIYVSLNLIIHPSVYLCQGFSACNLNIEMLYL